MFKNIVKELITNTAKEIKYGTIETRELGKIFAAFYVEDRKLHICSFYFALNNTIEMFANNLQKLWPKTKICKDDKLTKKVFAEYIKENKETPDVYVVLNGSDFEVKVWSALLNIPMGEERTYGEVAAMIGNPKAARAVANAIERNNILIFIPCHRVKASTNDKYKYKAGSDLKKKILLFEQKTK